MFCPKCGKPVLENAAFCQNCGSNVSPSPEEALAMPDVRPTYKDLKGKLASPLFLTLTVLVTCLTAAFLVFNGTLQILHVFITIGLWFMYSAATGENDTLLVTGIKFVQIPVKIAYVLMYVGAGLLVFTGLIMFAVFALIGGTVGDIMSEGVDVFLQGLESSGITLDLPAGLWETLAKDLSSLSAVALGIALLVAFAVAAVFLIVYNLIFTGSFSKYLTNAKKALVSCEPFEIYDKTVSVKLMIYGILTGLPVISTILSFVQSGNIVYITTSISTALTCAVCIVASVFIKKNAPENIDT